MTLKIKDKKLLCHLKSKIKKFFGRNCILDNFKCITRKFELQSLFVDKGSGSGSGIFPDPDPNPGDPKDRIRPDPDPQHCFKLWSLKLTPRLVVLKKIFLRRPILLKHCSLLPLLEQSLSPFKRKSHRIFQNLQCNPTPLLDLTMFAPKNVRDYS